MYACNLPVTELSPSVAQDWLKSKVYAGQRSLSKEHLGKIAFRIEQGDFPLTMAQMGTVQGTDERLLDAYHRASAVVVTGKAIPIVELKLDFPTPAERAAHYAEIDHCRPRALRDVVPPDMLGDDNYANPARVAAIGQAAELVEGNLRLEAFQRKTVLPAPDRLKFAVDWCSEAKLLFGAIYGSGALNYISRTFLRKASVAVLLPLLRAHPKETVTLLERVVRNELLSPGSAAHKLHVVLSGDKYSSSGPALLAFTQHFAYCCAKHILDLPCQNIVVPRDGVRLPGTDIVVPGS